MPQIYIAVLTYVRPIEEIETHLAAHMAWVRRHYAEGTFLVSGRRVPRTGGIILTRGESLDAVQALMTTDPFQANGLATVEIFPLQVTMAAEALKGVFLDT